MGLMQLQCKEAKDDASAMIFPTTDTLALQTQVTTRADTRFCGVVLFSPRHPTELHVHPPSSFPLNDACTSADAETSEDADG